MLREPPRRIRRRLYYNGVYPWFAVHLDQNEKIGKYGFKFFAAIEGYTRCPLHWKLVTSLRGLEHGRFYQEMVRCCGGRVPFATVVDGARAWNAVEHVVENFYWHHDPRPALISMAEGPMMVRSVVDQSAHFSPLRTF